MAMKHMIAVAGALVAALGAEAQVAVRGGVVHTMAGERIENGVVVITDGKIAAVGPAGSVTIPDGYEILEAAVVTPGLVDAHATVGLTGIYNQEQDQDQLDSSGPIQPELRAIDAYNPLDPLVAWLRSFGITTVHTGHAPGELVSGQTMVAKTVGNTADEAAILHPAAIAVTIGSGAERSGGAPGTRGKMIAMLRAELLKAQDYAAKMADADESKRPSRDLRMESLAMALAGEAPLLVTADSARDIASALRVADEFGLELILDSAADAHLVMDEIVASGFPVVIHPLMARPYGDRENLSFETPSMLKAAGVPFAVGSGFEGYVPKVRVVLFEAAIAAANGLSFDEALASITIDAARIAGVAERVGSIEVGKDGDLALYDGDPFEYTTHCVGVVIDGAVVSTEIR
jgi:imidazolonepropionase-like amidohydrolase